MGFIRDKMGNLFIPLLSRAGLRKKILLGMLLLLLLFSLCLALVTHTILLSTLRKQFQSKGINIARGLAVNSAVDVLTKNKLHLNLLVNNEKLLDKDIAYIFITDSSGQLFVHTFDKGFPVDLLRVNIASKGKDFNIQSLDTQLGIIYDIATPITSETSVLGQVRLGMKPNSIRQTTMALNLTFFTATIIIVLIGILLAYKLSSLITQPITQLVEVTRSISKGDFSGKIDIKTHDEIKLLGASFNEMSRSLERMIKEKQLLRVIEERGKIALELHEGLAQNLADFIKRLELCERLFSREPSSAREEFEALKKNAKDILQNTRQAISNLKLNQEEDTGFNLYDSLSEYLRNFRGQNNIKVELEMPCPGNEIMANKAKIIFSVIKEALTNIKKHSSAKIVNIILGCSDHMLSVNIKDDGRGFDVIQTKISASHNAKFGIIGMQEGIGAIGGKISISSKIGRGTEISVKVPLTQEEA
jgi:signal transduction histidine kinase